MKVTAAIVHQMREASGLGMQTCREAAIHAETHLGGDVVLALIYADVNAFAVSIKSRDPAVSDADARRAHMLALAENRRADMLRQPAWALLSDMCNAQKEITTSC
jgi:hypothetical protein